MYALPVRIGAITLVCATAFWLGYRVAAGTYEERIKDISVAISEAQNETIDRHNKALEVERKRAAASFESRGRQQQVAQGIKHEIAQDVDRTCEWREPHRVRIERLYGAYGHNPDGSTTGVSNPLPASPFDGTAQGAVGGGGVRLGR